jgi:competence protein ComEA
VNQLQRLGLIGMTGLLLLGFWAGLWYQGRRGEETLLLGAASDRAEAGEDGPTIPAASGATPGGGQDDLAAGGSRSAQAAGGKGAGESAGGSENEDAGVSAGEDGGADLAAGPFGPAASDGIGAGDGLAKGEWENGGDLAAHVVGRVAAPGLYFLPAGSRIYDAVMLAQPEEDADLARINLALPLEDGMQIRIPLLGKTSPWEGEALVVKAAPVGGGGGGGDTLSGSASSGAGAGNRDEQGRLNINQATKVELQTLPGIGEVYAQRIIQYREQQGQFKSVDELTKVKGIGAATLRELKDLVCCS